MRTVLFTQLILMVVLVSSCGKRPDIPTELVMADSAYMAGNHFRGDHLLAAYEMEAHDNSSYYSLLKLEQAYMHGTMSQSLFHLADSVLDYYQDKEGEETIKSLLFMGDICYNSNDYPSAIEYYLRAQEMAERTNNIRLQYIVSRSLGDLYYEQRDLDKCIPCYERYFRLSAANHDTLRMAYGAFRMARVHSINNDVDSIIYYYNLSKELGKSLPQDDIVPYAINRLCDIYIQTEQYDKALELMQHNELNDANWAYWHYGQHHTDSAVFYFKKVLGQFGWAGDVEVLPILAQLEVERGHLTAAVDYYKQFALAEDSLRMKQEEETTRRIEAQYNFNAIKEQRDRLETNNRELKLLLTVVLAVVLVTLLAWMASHQYRKATRMHRKLFEKAREDAQKQTPQQLEDNCRQRERLQKQLVSEPFYKRLKSADRNIDKRISEEEWVQIANYINGIHNNLEKRLLALYPLSETELRVCYLQKLGVPPSDIANILHKSRSAITLARSRMYRKLTTRSGTAEDFDRLIMEL